MKQDISYKVHFIYDISRIYPWGLSTRASAVKWVAMHLLGIISDTQYLKVLTYDIFSKFI